MRSAIILSSVQTMHPMSFGTYFMMSARRATNSLLRCIAVSERTLNGADPTYSFGLGDGTHTTVIGVPIPAFTTSSYDMEDTRGPNMPSTTMSNSTSPPNELLAIPNLAALLIAERRPAFFEK